MDAAERVPSPIPLSMQWPRVAAHDARHHGRQMVVAKRSDSSMAVRAVAEMVAAMKNVELGVLDAERTADSERDLRKQTEARVAAADARASAAEAERDTLHQQLAEWKSIAVQHQEQDKQYRERLDATMNETEERLRAAVDARAAMEKQLSKVSAALAESRIAQRALEAELEMTRQQLQHATGGQNPGSNAALRWGSAEWWRDGVRVGALGVGANATPPAAARTTPPQTAEPAPHLQRSFALGAESAGAGRASLAIALEAELSAATHERERLARDFGVVFGCGHNVVSPASAAVGSDGALGDDAAQPTCAPWKKTAAHV